MNPNFKLFLSTEITVGANHKFCMYFDTEWVESNCCNSKKPCGIIIAYSNFYKCKKQLLVSINFDYQLPLFIQLHLGGSITYDSPCTLCQKNTPGEYHEGK